MPAPARSILLWIPDWPVVALAREEGAAVIRDARVGRAPEAAGGAGAEAAVAVAVVAKNEVVACSAAARVDGVRRGQRRRDAQARCPRLRIVPADPARDQRAFAPVVAAIERMVPPVQIVRPGLCALRAKGPARYYGGEAQAVAAVRAGIVADGIADVRAGIADGPFTAEQAARVATAGDPVRIVPEGQAAAFLAPLPLSALGEDALASLLARLGVRTLGGFAAMDRERVRERLGESGVRLQALAAGADSRVVEPRVVPPDLHRERVFEAPVDSSEQVAFAVRVTAEEFIARLDQERLVCTELRVELDGDRGEHSERVWLHPGTFDAAAVVDRVRWQLAEEQTLRSGVTRVRISPEAVDAASHHVPGLFGAGPHERVHHALSRVQAILGHQGVLTPAVGGGRWLAERQVMVPWGDRVVIAQDPDRPWPGRLPAPLPGTVFDPPHPVAVQDATGAPVTVDDRGVLSGDPARLTVDGERRSVASWAGPWQLAEREWDAARRRLAHRMQVVDAAEQAWLLVCEDDRWRAEARYD